MSIKQSSLLSDNHSWAIVPSSLRLVPYSLLCSKSSTESESRIAAWMSTFAVYISEIQRTLTPGLGFVYGDADERVVVIDPGLGPVNPRDRELRGGDYLMTTGFIGAPVPPTTFKGADTNRKA